MNKDIFEDALIELREKEFEKKFRNEKEKMVGDKHKTVWMCGEIISINEVLVDRPLHLFLETDVGSHLHEAHPLVQAEHLLTHHRSQFFAARDELSGQRFHRLHYLRLAFVLHQGWLGADVAHAFIDGCHSFVFWQRLYLFRRLLRIYRFACPPRIRFGSHVLGVVNNPDIRIITSLRIFLFL